MAAYFHKLRTGERQEVKVNARHAVIEFSEFSLLLVISWSSNADASRMMLWRNVPDSEKYYTIDGHTSAEPLRDELTGIYRAKEGYVRLHMNFQQSASFPSCLLHPD